MFNYVVGENNQNWKKLRENKSQFIGLSLFFSKLWDFFF